MDNITVGPALRRNNLGLFIDTQFHDDRFDLSAKLIHELIALTPDDIATRLISLGIRARLNEPKSCAVAEYVKSSTGLPEVAVTKFGISLHDGDEHYQLVHWDLSSLAHFVLRFDAGWYPELIEDWNVA